MAPSRTAKPCSSGATRPDPFSLQLEFFHDHPDHPGRLARRAAACDLDHLAVRLVSEITTDDAASRRHECVGKFIQSGARPKAEAQANLVALTRVPEMLRLLDAMVGVIDMSDPEHETFADSGADCLDELLQHETALRAILEEFGLREPKPDDQD